MKRELKHLLELMCKRDKWDSNQRVKEAKAIVSMKKKKTTKLGRKKEAEKFEHVQRKRLEQKANMDRSSSIEFEVEHGPRLPGLDGFGMYRRQKDQIAEYNRKKKEQERKRRELSRCGSTSSSTGSVKPLHKVLGKQSQALPGASLRALAQEDVFREINTTRDSGANVSRSEKSNRNAPAAIDNTAASNEPDYEGQNGIVGVPRGYVKANTLKLMQEVYKQQTTLMNNTKDKFNTMSHQFKVSRPEWI